MSTTLVRRVTALTDQQLQDLAGLLLDCVEGGASVGFMQPLSHARALAFWCGVAEGVARDERALLLAEDAAGRVIGTVQVLLAQPENQPHRADIAKMLVHRRARRQGLGALLIQAAEQLAARQGKTLLVLDTASDDAERLYERQGWQRCGVIPGYAMWPAGGLCPTTIFFKALPG
jgi:GNAT superfamily N-acetyltransferase